MLSDPLGGVSTASSVLSKGVVVNASKTRRIYDLARGGGGAAKS